MIWLVAGAITLAVLLYVTYPLYSQNSPSQTPDIEVSDYATEIQALEVEITAETGEVSQLEAAKTDLERRLLAGAKAPKTKEPRPSAVLVSSLFVVVSFATIGLYSTLGRPEFATSEKLATTQMNVSRAISQNEEPQHENNMSLDQLVVRLEDKLKQDDRDPEGWMLYARSLMTLKRFDDALIAYENVLILTNNNPNVAEELESAKSFIDKARNPQVPTLNAGNFAPGPSSEDVEAAAAMSDEGRQAMIQNMVDGLSAKLVDDPQNVDGWVRLLRARKVLNQSDEAGIEINRMREVFADEPEKIAAVLNASGWPQTK